MSSRSAAIFNDMSTIYEGINAQMPRSSNVTVGMLSFDHEAMNYKNTVLISDKSW